MAIRGSDSFRTASSSSSRIGSNDSTASDLSAEKEKIRSKKRNASKPSKSVLLEQSPMRIVHTAPRAQRLSTSRKLKPAPASLPGFDRDWNALYDQPRMATQPQGSQVGVADNTVLSPLKSSALKASAKPSGPSAPSSSVFSHPVKMHKRYRREEFGEVFGTSVEYLSKAQRKQYRVHIENGLLYDAKGKLIDTSDATRLDLAGYTGHVKGRAIYTVPMKDPVEIYLSKKQIQGRFHHSSFDKGRPVGVAGDCVVEQGRLLVLTNASGHYRPADDALDEFAQHLRSQGVDGFNTVHFEASKS